MYNNKLFAAHAIETQNVSPSPFLPPPSKHLCSLSLTFHEVLSHTEEGGVILLYSDVWGFLEAQLDGNGHTVRLLLLLLDGHQCLLVDLVKTITQNLKCKYTVAHKMTYQK